MSDNSPAPEAAISSQYAITLRIDYPRAPGRIAKIAATIGDMGGVIRAIDLVDIRGKRSLRDYTVECASTDHARRIIEAVRGVEDLNLESVSDETFLMHLGGKLEIQSKVALKTRVDLSMAYTPGVARVCRAIEAEPKTSHALTIRRNCVAVISDGSAVLGLGNIGACAAMPVMEGKAILFKEFAGVDAFPLCLDTQDVQEIVAIGKAVAPTFGAINLEDISAPRCFTIERELDEALDIPVFHDDQHGTAVVTLAATLNALKIKGKRPQDMKLVVSGAGAAGWACTRALKNLGFGNIIVCDRQGALHRGRDVGSNPAKLWFVENTNPEQETGGVKTALHGADMFLGLSAPGLLGRDDLKTMAAQPIVFAMANPTPEIMPEEAEGIVGVMATGRSDYPNQINNVLAFPGIFRGALDARAHRINDEMKGAAAQAIAEVVTDQELSPDYIVPSVFNRTVASEVARAVARAARNTKVARRIPKGIDIYQ
ncbi:MAG: NAD-dependent malic enzyme [Acidobacteriota bacterium]|jgi:malate dehydrogenase (oxaloacetate-decarboxylating)